MKQKDLNTIIEKNDLFKVNLRGSDDRLSELLLVQALRTRLGDKYEPDGMTTGGDFPERVVGPLADFFEDVKSDKIITVGILVDVDVDGYMSGAMMQLFLEANSTDEDTDIIEILPDDKAHGLKANFDKCNRGFNYLILPDSSSNDINEIQKLQSKGTKVIVIDHHISDHIDYLDDHEDLVIINNQLPWFYGVLNDNLTGAGMVRNVIDFLVETAGAIDLPEKRDMMALGQIADMSDLKDYEVSIEVSDALLDFQHPFFKSFFKDDPEVMSIKHMQFSIIPRINAVSRVGTPEERRAIYDALIEMSTEHEVKKRSGNVVMNAYDYATDVITKVKGRQDRKVKKAVEEARVISSGNVNVIEMPDNVEKGLSGLIANKYLGNTKKPTFVVKPFKDLLSGSARIPEQYKYGKDMVNAVDGVTLAAGHQQAFGFAMKEADYSDTVKMLNTLFDSNNDVEYEVDRVYLESLPTVEDIRDVYNSEDEFSGAKDAVTVAVFGFRIPKRLKLTNRYLNMFANDILIVNYNMTDELIKEINTGFGDKYINFVASVGMNFWGKEPTPILVMDHMAMGEQLKDAVTTDTIVF